MCLIKTHRLPKISRKPIQVYKIFYNPIDNELVTPYQRQISKVGEIIKAKHSWLKGIFKSEIGGEGVHAFRTNIIASWRVQQFSDGRVYLCKIPPFTPYWIGVFDDIAASKMIIKERVEL